jgi:hypothetical protein
MPAGGEGRLGNVASATQTAQTQASQAAAAQASQQKALQGYASTAIGDLNSGNYAGAWDAALQSSTLYNTNYNSTTTDPLLQALESGTGLQALDPSKKWDANSIQAYYTAMEQNPVYQGKTVANTVNGQTGNESFGKNPYGDWGSGAAALNGTDVKANLGAAGDNSAPDVQRFAGAKPTKSFLSKYGTDIAMLAAAVAAPELIGAPQIFNVTHLLDYWYGVTWNATRRDMARWKQAPDEVYRFAVQAFFERTDFLRTLQHWILFYVQDSETRKSVLRQHQRRAIDAIVARCADPTKTRGLVWHTQGSGKPLPCSQPRS